MAHTGCKCGVSIWNGYGPGGVNWDIFPMELFRKEAYDNPEMELYDLICLIEDKYQNGDFHDFWLCRRCKRIQIWKMDGLYVSYKPVRWDHTPDLNTILGMEEWMAINDYDWECSAEPFTAVYLLEHPCRPFRYFMSGDKTKIYVYNSSTEQIEWVYEEECRELEKGKYRDAHGIYTHKYEMRNGHNYYAGSVYEDGTELADKNRNGDLSDAVYGAILGDTLGRAYTGMKKGTFKCTGMNGTKTSPAGAWSLSIGLMLATAKSLKDNDLTVNIDDLADRYRDCMNNTGIFSETEKLQGEVRRDEYDAGSLLRVLPLAFAECTDDEVVKVCEILNDSASVAEACVIFTGLIRKYLTQDRSQGDVKGITAIIRNFVEAEGIRGEDNAAEGSVTQILSSAFRVFLETDEYPKYEYEDCLKEAVNLGGNASAASAASAVTGALAGLRYSYDSIPDDWTWKIRNNMLIQDCLF